MGSNAVNGVINIITKSAKETEGVFAEVGLGTELEAYGGLRYGGKIKDQISYRIFGMEQNGAVFRIWKE